MLASGRSKSCSRALFSKVTQCGGSFSYTSPFAVRCLTTTHKAIRVEQHGGPEVLRCVSVPVPTPQPNEVLVKNSAIGVNYIDTYHREGKYPTNLPFTPGLEGAGEVVAVGPGVTSLKVGDRVGYMLASTGMNAYAEHTVVPLAQAIPLPGALSYEEGAAVLLQGMTAHALIKDCYPVKKGDTVLIHAAAGGMGLLLCQATRALGATVIGTTSSEEKAKMAIAAGAHHIINYTTHDFVEEIKRITNERKVSVVFDGVGKTTFLKGLDCLQPRGHMVLYGAASGQPDPIAPAILGNKGSLFLTRASLFHYIATEHEFKDRAKAVFNWVAQKVICPHIYRPKFKLQDAVLAHDALEGRKTTGKILLEP